MVIEKNKMRKKLKTKLGNYILTILLIFCFGFIIVLVKNSGGQNLNLGYAKSSSESQAINTDGYKKYGNCSYYKSQVREIKSAFMRDLGISSDDDLAAFLAELKDNPNKRKEFKDNKKFASYNIELLLKGEENNGNKYPGDLDNYEKAAKIVCENKKDSASISIDIDVVKILAEGLKSYKIPEDRINAIWSEDYLKKQ